MLPAPIVTRSSSRSRMPARSWRQGFFSGFNPPRNGADLVCQRLLDLVVEDPDAGLERAERDLFDRAGSKAVLAERGGAIILGREHALIEQSPALLPMILLIAVAGRFGNEHEVLDEG